MAKTRLLSIVPSMLLIGSAAFAQLGDSLEVGKKLYDKGQYADALVAFKASLMRNPNDYQAWYYVGASDYRLKHYEEAIESFNKYFMLSEPNSKDQSAAYYYLAFCKYDMGLFAEAIEAMEKHFAIYKHLGRTPDSTAFAVLGRCRVMVGKYQEALEPLKKAAIKSEPNSTNYYYLGLAQLKSGKRDEALDSLKMGLKINADDKQIQALITEEFASESNSSRSSKDSKDAEYSSTNRR